MKYFKINPEDNTFDVLVADITHRCNMKCANCYIPNRNIPDMDSTKLYSFLKKLPKRVYIRLIGAEPTMRKDLCDIILNIKKRGHKCSLTTHGLKLSHRSYVRELKQAGLRSVLISMNGAHNDNIYKIIDNGKYATLKVKALHNCMLENMIINTGTIIAKGINECTILEQINLVRKKMKETNYKSKVKPILRFKSVGKIGRYMKDASYSLSELEKQFKYYIRDVNRIDDITSPNHAILTNFYEMEDMFIRLIDWSIDEEGVPDSKNEIRGRITKDWKITPFFEDVKVNEFGY